MIINDPRCAEQWDDGSPKKAARLLEAWGSTAAITLLQREEDQSAVRAGVGAGFAMLFDSDEEELKAELLHYHEALRADEPRMKQRGAVGSWTVLYLRTLKALGNDGVPSFSSLPMPLCTADEILAMVGTQDIDATVLTSLAPLGVVPEVLLQTLDAAQRAFDDMDRGG